VIPEEFLVQVPKTDLHLHLDGSIRIETLIELARQYGVELPADSEEGLRKKVFKAEYASLPDYLEGFKYCTAVLQSEVALNRVSYELACDNQVEGVRYMEVRFAPQLHVHQHLSMENVLRAVNQGLARAQQEFNSRSEVVEGKEPPFNYGIVVCALRMFPPGSSEYYDHILNVHQHSDPRQVYALASLELARATVQIKRHYNLPIVGIDLAGQEEGYPAVDHRAAFAHAHKHFLKKTVHAGEAYGPESIFQAITELHADRIGHGTHLFDADMIKDPEIADPQEYVNELAQFIADRRITLEICLTSNLQTHPELRELSDHKYRNMAAERLSTTFCTDNRTISGTTVTAELRKAIEHLGVSLKDLRNSIIYGFKRSFYPGSYLEKRQYVRKIIDYYTAVEEQFGLQSD
jgi:adenosine deaminase